MYPFLLPNNVFIGCYTITEPVEMNDSIMNINQPSVVNSSCIASRKNGNM